MDIGKLRSRLPELVNKYKYAALVVLVGIVLMTIPSISIKKTDSAGTVQSEENTEDTTAQQLSHILSQIAGAGKVEVMLTLASGEETVYQTNENITISENGSSSQKTTVTVTDSERNQSGLICQKIPARYMGAVVVCQGADSPTVQLAVVEAVSKVTGLGADRISVLKMK